MIPKDIPKSTVIMWFSYYTNKEGEGVSENGSNKIYYKDFKSTDYYRMPGPAKSEKTEYEFYNYKYYELADKIKRKKKIVDKHNKEYDDLIKEQEECKTNRDNIKMEIDNE